MLFRYFALDYTPSNYAPKVEFASKIYFSKEEVTDAVRQCTVLQECTPDMISRTATIIASNGTIFNAKGKEVTDYRLSAHLKFDISIIGRQYNDKLLCCITNKCK